MMMRSILTSVAGSTLCVVALLSVAAQEPSRDEKPEIPGGIEGHVKSVDHDKQTLTIIGPGARERIFTITDDTMMVGPRGEKVRRRLNDPRFHEGLEIIIVANGSAAKEVHLGYNRRQNEDAKSEAKAAAKKNPGLTRSRREEVAADFGKRQASPETGKVASKAATKAVATAEEEDEDDEIPAKVKSYNSTARTPVLVVTLLNGKNRSFFLSSEVKVLVNGTTSKLGLKDPALKAGAPLTVFVHPGGRRVKELHVNPPPPARSKKAA
jgi:hypothetical protein